MRWHCSWRLDLHERHDSLSRLHVALAVGLFLECPQHLVDRGLDASETVVTQATSATRASREARARGERGMGNASSREETKERRRERKRLAAEAASLAQAYGHSSLAEAYIGVTLSHQYRPSSKVGGRALSPLSRRQLSYPLPMHSALHLKRASSTARR